MLNRQPESRKPVTYSASPNVRKQQVGEGCQDGVYGEEVQQLVVAGGPIDAVEDVFSDPDRHEEDTDDDREAEDSHEDIAVVGA